MIIFSYFDDQVLDFLRKIQPLFTNVDLYLGDHTFILLDHLLPNLLPMIGSIRGIHCEHIRYLEQHFPGTLALAKELELGFAGPACIPEYFDWLSAPQDFDQHGPKFLKLMDSYCPQTGHVAIIDTVRKVSFKLKYSRLNPSKAENWFNF